MNSLAELMVILWLATALILIVYYTLHNKREKQMLQALQQSLLYANLHRKISYLFRHYEIDQLRIEQHGVTVTSVFPAHTLLDFDFKQNGNSKRSCCTSRLMMQLIYTDFPMLARRDIYKMSRYCVYRSNGKKEYGFSFTMRRSYKENLLRNRMLTRINIL